MPPVCTQHVRLNLDAQDLIATTCMLQTTLSDHEAAFGFGFGLYSMTADRFVIDTLVQS